MNNGLKSVATKFNRGYASASKWLVFFRRHTTTLHPQIHKPIQQQLRAVGSCTFCNPGFQPRVS